MKDVVSGVELDRPRAGGGGVHRPGRVGLDLAGTTNEHGMKAATGEFQVEADDFYFERTYIRATPGEAPQSGTAVSTVS